MNRIVFVLLFLPVSLFAQVNRYFVSFKDKVGSIYSVANPLQFLSQKSLDRRSRENFVVTEEDFPVNANYVQQVKATGAQVYFTSRWFNGVLVQTDASLVTAISALPFVTKVELVGWGTRLTGGRVAYNQNLEKFGSLSEPLNQTQSVMIGIDKMHAAGFQGEGVDVAVFDAGFNGVDTLSAFKAMYLEGRVKSTFNFVENSTNVYAGYPHGSMVLSIMAGNIPGVYLGGVPKANYFLYQTEDASTEYRVEEYNWLFAAEKADSAGVDVINSSLGYSVFDDPWMNYTYNDLDGRTTVIARAARKVIKRGVVVVNAAGNEGNTNWRYILSPADAEGIISCGGVNSSLIRVSFSSIGPSSDGRIKPDVSAMAGQTLVIRDNGVLWAGNGTSFASPQVACLAAGLRQAFPAASAGQIYSLIINSASQAAHPDNYLGYGIPDFEKAKQLNSEFQIYPNPVNTTSNLQIHFAYPDGQNFSVTIINSNGQKVFEKRATVFLNTNPYTVDVSPFATGLYYVLISTSVGTQSHKIVIIH